MFTPSIPASIFSNKGLVTNFVKDVTSGKNPFEFDLHDTFGYRLIDGISNAARDFSESLGINSLSDLGDVASGLLNSARNSLSSFFDGDNSKRTISSGRASSARDWQYLNADLAQAYGMSKETAYNEAMANTAYQRATKDMIAAGLNPALMFGKADSSSSPFAQESNSGRSYGRSSGRSTQDSKSGLWQGLASIFAGAGAYAITKDPSAAVTAAQIAGTAAKNIANSRS